MHAHPLDNPFWSSLATRHRHLALRAGDVARFPPDYAPFLGIADAGVDIGAAGEGDAPLVAPGESVYLLGVAPARVPAGWTLQAFDDLAQMACMSPLDVPDGPEVAALEAPQREEVLALTALVYPHYFRARTMELGGYYGIHARDGHGARRLAAMIGERLGTDAHTEMSAICTHPDFGGRGYARRLTALLTNATLAEGRLPFLHVSHANARAKALYAGMGYRLRRNIGFWSLRRDA